MAKECTVRVDAGVCKMVTTIHAKENEMGMIELDIQSDCPNVLKMSWIVQPVSPWTEVEAAMNETEIYKWASDRLPHAACPVPCAMIKAVEVAGDLGLKRNVTLYKERQLLKLLVQRLWQDLHYPKIHFLNLSGRSLFNSSFEKYCSSSYFRAFCAFL